MSTEICCRGSILLGSGCGTCSRCLKEYAHIVEKYRELTKKCDIETQARQGWICPVCGKGCSPSMTQCSCK